MDNFENPTPVPANLPDPAEWQAQCDSLRQLVVTVLVLLLVVSGTLTIYLLRQWRYASRDLEAMRPQAAQFSKMAGPVNQFVNELIDFSRQHPDFAPILAKNGIRSAGTAPATGVAPPVPQKK